MDDLLELGVETAREAGELLRGYFSKPSSGVDTKSTPTDPVSDADRESETLILDRVRRARPDDGFVGEEGADREGSSGLTWVIDPLDGTVNFLYGIPVWCVSIAVKDADGLAVGVVHCPMQDETFTAIRGRGAWLNGSPISVTSCNELSQALIGTGFSYESDIRRAQAEVVKRILPVVRDIRRAGSAAIDLASLACGRLDGFYEAPMMEWDRAAGELLIREAGGLVVDLPPAEGDDRGVIAAGLALHPALVDLVTK